MDAGVDIIACGSHIADEPILKHDKHLESLDIIILATRKEKVKAEIAGKSNLKRNLNEKGLPRVRESEDRGDVICDKVFRHPQEYDRFDPQIL